MTACHVDVFFAKPQQYRNAVHKNLSRQLCTVKETPTISVNRMSSITISSSPRTLPKKHNFQRHFSSVGTSIYVPIMHANWLSGSSRFLQFSADIHNCTCMSPNALLCEHCSRDLRMHLTAQRWQCHQSPTTPAPNGMFLVLTWDPTPNPPWVRLGAWVGYTGMM